MITIRCPKKLKTLMERRQTLWFIELLTGFDHTQIDPTTGQKLYGIVFPSGREYYRNGLVRLEIDDDDYFDRPIVVERGEQS